MYYDEEDIFNLETRQDSLLSRQQSRIAAPPRNKTCKGLNRLGSSGNDSNHSIVYGDGESQIIHTSF